MLNFHCKRDGGAFDVVLLLDHAYKRYVTVGTILKEKDKWVFSLTGYGGCLSSVEIKQILIQIEILESL